MNERHWRDQSDDHDDRDRGRGRRQDRMEGDYGGRDYARGRDHGADHGRYLARGRYDEGGYPWRNHDPYRGDPGYRGAWDDAYGPRDPYRESWYQGSYGEPGGFFGGGWYGAGVYAPPGAFGPDRRHGGVPGGGYARGGSGDHERGFFARAADEVSSWFGDEEAERRREQDHRGRGPQNYRRPDSRIQEDVSDRLTDDDTVDASGIAVQVKDREVTLDGTVSSRYAKRRAEDCAESVSGVQHVQNNLRVQEGGAGTAPSVASSGSSLAGRSAATTGAAGTTTATGRHN